MASTISVLIADDEQAIRTGLREVISRLPVEQLEIGCVSNGTQALHYLHSHSVDIGIIDVSMPETDGLEVIREAYEEKMPTRFLILSGYSEFSYAQTAIRYGVKSYFLKPLNVQDFRSFFLRQCQEILAQRSNEEPNRQERERLRASARALILSRLVHGQTGGTQVDYAQLDICDLPSCSIVFQQASAIPGGNPREAEVAGILREAFTGTPVEIWPDGPNRVVVILNLDDADEPSLRTVTQRALKLLQDRTGLTFWAGIGLLVESPAQISHSIAKAQEAMSYHIYNTEATLFDANSIDWTRPAFSQENVDLEPLVQAILQHEKENIRSYVDLFFANLLDGGTPPPSFVIGMCMNLILNTQKQVQLKNPDNPVDLDPTYEKILSQQSIERIQQWVTELLIGYSDILRETAGEQDSVIRQAKEYIRTHLQEPIKARDVAARVNLSETYFTSYFKERAGVTFRDYLVGERIRLAKRLLLDRNTNIGEIAERTGYQDYRSFTRTFKNETGMTPSEYQRRRAE